MDKRQQALLLFLLLVLSRLIWLGMSRSNPLWDWSGILVIAGIATYYFWQRK